MVYYRGLTGVLESDIAMRLSPGAMGVEYTQLGPLLLLLGGDRDVRTV